MAKGATPRTLARGACQAARAALRLWDLPEPDDDRHPLTAHAEPSHRVGRAVPTTASRCHRPLSSAVVPPSLALRARDWEAAN